MRVWVVGSGGMLGSAIVEQAPGGARLFAPLPVPWHDEAAATAVLEADVARLGAEAADEEWAVIWAAGSSVVSSSTGETSSELTLLTRLLQVLVRERPAGRGVFFLTSSAGGVYAGSADPPFDASTDPRPISPYGQLKLDQENAARAILEGVIPVVIGRFSNLYGPRSNEAKGQGLIPQLCLATIRRRPLNLYVSMDTVRDYLYVDDAAALTWDAVTDALAEQPGHAQIAVIASGQPTTVAQVIATVQQVAHRRVPVALGTHPSSQHQAIDLRLVPSASPLDLRATLTPLPSGIKRIFDSISGRVN